jgi:hypothetical protein
MRSDPVRGSIESVASMAMASARNVIASEPPGVVPQASSVDGPANTVRPPICPTGSPVHHVATPSREETNEESVNGQARQPFVLAPPRAERLEPLSPGRFRVQFTADAALKEKLELARDLMRHTLPSGDLASIVARSVDLLIADLMKRRFGAPARRDQPHTFRRPNPPTSSEQPTNTEPPTTTGRLVSTEQPTTTERPTPATQSDRDLAFTSTAAPTHPPERFDGADTVERPDSPATDPTATRVDRTTRRAVLERDGLRCAWRSADGVRCEARAWLEHDHIRPRAKGGSSSANNGRLLCRPHNRLAAELEFGRQHVEQAIAKQRAKRRPIPSEP